MTRVILTLQEKACLLTRHSSHDSDSSIHYLALVEARVVVRGPDHDRVVGGHRRLFLFTLLNFLGGYSGVP